MSMRSGWASMSTSSVSGPTIRARVTQLFRNPTADWVEATYVYPLPAGGAVDTLKMVVGDRVMVGEIKERQQAKCHLRAGSSQRAEGGADRTGAAEHLHQLVRQYRPRRNRAGADRIPGAGAAVRQRILAAGADGGRARATIRHRSCKASTSAPMAAAGPELLRSGAGPRPHLAASAGPRAAWRRSIRPASPCTSAPASRSAR